MFTLFGSMGAVVDRISSIGLVLVMKCLEMPLTQVGRRPAPGESWAEHCQRNAGSQTTLPSIEPPPLVCGVIDLCSSELETLCVLRRSQLCSSSSLSISSPTAVLLTLHTHTQA